MGWFDRKAVAAEEPAALIKRIGSGDEAALEEFYERYFPRLYRYIFYRVGRDHHHTEEVVNDTFMEALEKSGQYDPARGSVESWLITMSRNRIRSLNLLMGKAREYEHSWSLVDGELESLFADLDRRNLPDAALEAMELKELVSATMCSIPSKYSELLEMKYTAGMSVKDMAEKLHKTEKSIESQLTRAREAFREAFGVMATEMPAV